VPRLNTPLGAIDVQLGKIESDCKYNTYAFMAFIQTTENHRVSTTSEKQPLNARTLSELPGDTTADD
jgi:hypothetical protein